MKLTLLFSGALLVLCFPFLSGARTNIPAMQASPLSFIENKGQVTDQDFNARPDIDFKLGTPGVNIFIGKGSLHYQWVKNTGEIFDKAQPAQGHSKIETYRLDVVLEGANKNAVMIKEEKQPFFENYYSEQTPGGLVAHAYNKIVYKDIYPHIDWILYSSNNRLKYDFVVHPGGNVKDIRINYDGATSLTAANGAVTVTTPLGQVTEQKPYSYTAETKRAVNSSFSLKNNTLGFSASATDGTLVIDPVLEWATYFGGTSGEEARDVTTDNSGNVYIAGITASSNLATAGAHQMNVDAPFDGFIAKFNRQGQRLWSTYYGGNFYDAINNIIADPGGAIYVAGISTSVNGISSAGSSKPFPGGGDDAFLAKFSSTGTRLWGTYFGDSGDDDAYGLALDHSGNVCITGSTNSTTSIATIGVYQTALAGNEDAFVAKFSSNGNWLWGTYYGQLYTDMAYGIACDGNDNIYICGQTFSPNLFIKPGAHQTTFGGGGTDAFLVKFDNMGLLQWNTYYGGSSNDRAYDLSCNALGDVYMAGSTNSANAIASAGAPQSVLNGIGDGFLVKFDKDGVRQWGTYYGGNSGDEFTGLSISPDGYVYATGTTQSTTGVATAGSYQGTYAGGLFDGLLVQFKENGSLGWATYYGGPYRDIANKVANDFAGSIYVCGYTDSSANLSSPGAFQSALSVSWDAFLAKFQDTTVFIDQPFTDTVFCTPSLHNISYLMQTPFRNGNTFTVQLSDASGSFATPLNIGTITPGTTPNGIILVTIPASIPPGSHYRIRIVASAPAYISPDNGVDIRILPKAPVPEVTGKTNLCSGDSIALTVTNPAAGFNYQWTGPNGVSVSGSTLVIHQTTTPASGDYIVAAGTGGCNVADTVNVTVKPRPYLVSSKSNSPVCDGSTLMLSVTANDSTARYNWYGPKGFSSLEHNPSIPNAREDNSGQYAILFVGANGCISDSNFVYVNVLKLRPQISGGGILYPGDTLQLKSSVNWDSVGYTWTGPGGYYSNDTNVFLEDITKAEAYGTYTLTVNYRGCTGTASAKVIVSEIIHLYLFPNPNDGNFTVKGNILDNDVVYMEVVDEAGRAYYRDSVKPFRKHFEKQIHLGENLANGMYILRTTVKDKRHDLRFGIMR